MKQNLMKKNYNEITNERLKLTFTQKEIEIIQYIKHLTESKNIDNISRTESYFQFYQQYPEIKWAFLASMVSRNAGWNMTDLRGKWLPKVLSEKHLNVLFLTYERANWLIFHDVYPQLLIYQLSKASEHSLFHLLKAFSVSVYMEMEWLKFWSEQDEQRILHSLIINEQHVIQKPVIEHPYYKKKVFQSLTFHIQDLFHFSQVLFPTVEGELYGFSTQQFRKVQTRIDLGKKLAWLLFNEKYYPLFYTFAKKTAHTGSRHDYEQYFPYKKERETPFLRVVFPVIKHELDGNQIDWYFGQQSIEKLQNKPKISSTYVLTKWYKKKQVQLQVGILLESLIVK